MTSKGSKGKVFLIPVPIADDRIDTLSGEVIPVVRSIQYFLVERVRTARRFLRSVDRTIDIDGLTFAEIGEDHWKPILERAMRGENVGVISEAGCPAVADPGSEVVAECHRLGIEVVPLVGPSSILLALMGSGFSGQGFCFHGYLPVNKNELKHAIRQLEAEVSRTGNTQLFMETPYRSQRMFAFLVQTLRPDSVLSVASDLTGPQASIATHVVSEWATRQDPPIEKQPCIFSIGVIQK